MTIRTFRGKTPGEALAQVKRELGSNAVILHTRTSKSAGVLGLGSRAWTEITATSTAGAGTGSPGRGGTRERAGGIPAAKTPSVVAPSGKDRSEVDRQDIVELVGAAAAKAGRRRQKEEGLSSEAVAEAMRAGHGRDRGATKEQGFADGGGRLGRVPGGHPEVRDVARAVIEGAGIGGLRGSGGVVGGVGGDDAARARSLEQEIALIRRMVGQVLQTSRGGKGVGLGGTMPGALEECYIKLLESEVASEIADEVVGRVRDELSPAELEDRGVVRQTVVRRLAALIPVHSEPVATARPADGRPRTIALVGPTGVGKTTTIAKLAATYKLRLQKKVGLVTSDTYRIAAVDQLRTYANIIGLPLEVTLTPTEMTRAVRSLSDCDVILIDTAGRSQHDEHRVEELRAFLEAAQPHERHLVLSSTAGQSVLNRTASAFAAVDPSHVIFTKLDEAVNFGVLLSVIRNVNAKLSFVTTGQEVPDQIERGNAERLARLVLDGGR